ncbi:Dyp-type peroxidase [Corynebacterium felinum]|uniref:Dye decolorizing peroxidase n=1 Tax=Corynebacterium felinum TaxID=131318 RepID=A0ABU2BB13_9CORY|nr:MULTISPECIES: Dyp-type peroxidase [Corynebacterium]MDF5821376.1 Dyp-type peroxidase [Corynebacterium felinum]MDO4760292.1 Dyp-type peroxidase [Corynebacterium sp.]MDR7355824.1 dye decolorizing peroxidase [Corynebacterium felinum]WJY95169.1 Dye-decolorizing peroxidase precursor [Corynebacterium felinum]
MSSLCPHNANDNNRHHEPSGPVLSRRNFMLGASVASSAVALAACSNAVTASTDSSAEQAADPQLHLTTATVPFDGEHQAGVDTPGQAHVNVIAFSLRAGNNAESVSRLLKLWTEDARRLTQGENPLGSLEPEMTTTPANLTITCGFGPRFFDIIGKPEQRPEWLAPLPKFSEDKLDPAWGDSDIVLQVCCDDPVTLAFATRHMHRAAVDFAQIQWMQQGFLTANGSRKPESTPRNLFGQLDGTVNPRKDEEYDDYVWINSTKQAPKWAQGGTCMVVRRINMDLDRWEILDRFSREESMGRFLHNGAPLTGTDEFDPADFEARDDYGLPVIDPRSHMALAAPAANEPKQRMRRRAYNYDEAPIPGSDQSSNAGLIFICFQQNPLTQFVPIQQRLNDGDRLNEWITHIGSAVYVIPPGTSENESTRDTYWGQSLLES